MPMSSFEVAMQTMGSAVSDYLEDKNGVPVITNDGLTQLVKEQFPHCKKEEIKPGVFQIRIPQNETSPGYSPFDFPEAPRFPGDVNDRLPPRLVDIYLLLGGPKELCITI